MRLDWQILEGGTQRGQQQAELTIHGSNLKRCSCQASRKTDNFCLTQAMTQNSQSICSLQLQSQSQLMFALGLEVPYKEIFCYSGGHGSGVR